MEIEELVDAIGANRIRVTDHADEEAISDDLKLDEVLTSILRGEMIEEYPTDRPYPSCLIYSRAPDGSHVHSVRGYNERNGWAVLITVYNLTPSSGSIGGGGGRSYVF